METGVILSIGGLGFLSLLMISYFLQERPNTIGSKLYRILLLIVAVILATEIVSAYSILTLNMELLGYLNLRLSWFMGIFWFWLFYLYGICFLRDANATSILELIKVETRCKIISILSVIASIIYFILPMNRNMTLENFTFVPGYAAYFVIGYVGLIAGLTFILMIKRRHEINARSRGAVVLILVLVAFIGSLQFVFPRTIIVGLAFAIAMFILYFYIENPDLLMIASLEELKKDVEKSSSAKTEILSSMSREIKSPMDAIVGYSEAIIDGQNYDKESIRPNLENITLSGKKLLDIINNILNISKIESENEKLEEREYSVKNIIIELSSIMESRLEKGPVEFITEIDSQIPSQLYGDGPKIFQILLNILTNSSKNTEVGKIKLEASKETNSDRVTLKFKVIDTGSGIKKEDYDKVLEKFSGNSSTAIDDVNGIGVDLVIAKNYVDLLGGKIWFESDYGIGTTFYIEIPQRIVDPTPIGDVKAIQTKDEKLEYLDCSGKKVLIVDDNTLNIKATKRILSRYKFTIETLNSGRECIYKIKAGQKYDMIFLDHMMPEMDGMKVAHILKSLEDYKIPPLVALTANAMIGDKDEYLNSEFDECLSKPINLVELNQLINKYFKKDDV